MAAIGEGERVQHALELAYRHLARRDRTAHEIREHLARKGVEPDIAAAALAELEAQGYVDDARYATRFAEDRRTLDGWGRERIERRLLEAGIAPDVASAALGSVAGGAEDEAEAALAVLRRRLPMPPQDDRARARALGMLVRRGYALEVAHDAIRAFERTG
jgi:regulatory protein